MYKGFKKGAIVVEAVFVCFVILGVSIFFWTLNSNISNHSHLEQVVYDAILDARDELYIYSKLSDYLELGKAQNQLMDKLTKHLHLSKKLDSRYINSIINDNLLNLYLEQKIKARLNANFKEKFQLKSDPSIKCNRVDHNLSVEVFLDFEFKNPIDLFRGYKNCIRYEVGFRNLDRFIFEGEDPESLKVDSEKKKSFYVTDHGLFKSGVYHTNSDCFGLRNSTTTKEVEAELSKDGKLNYAGRDLVKCPFCMMGIRHGSK